MVKKILISPDKFKDSLTAIEVCEAIEKGIVSVFPEIQITKLPLADGGEGSLENLEKSLQFNKKYIKVHNPVFEKIETWYGLKEQTAYIEMAKASGLQLLTEKQRNPLSTTSLGTGELINDAIENGAKNIFLFIGGSATNDAAMGIANALGYKFYDEDNNELLPVGRSLGKIVNIKLERKINFDDFKFTVLTDVTNPFYGNNGAAFVYAPQKGADNNSIKLLDDGLKNIARLFSNIFRKDVNRIPGSGAAGGIGGGMIAFFNAQLKSGIESIFDLLNYEKFVVNSDLIITGEGKFDQQTLEGKVVKGVIDICKKHDKPLGIVCGVSTVDINKLNIYENIIVKSITEDGVEHNDAIQNASYYLQKKSEDLVKLKLSQLSSSLNKF